MNTLCKYAGLKCQNCPEIDFNCQSQKANEYRREEDD